jgi:glutathione S-transferase
MITLYHFGPNFGLPDPSPFCLKVDLYLRAAGLEFETRAGLQHMRRAPKGKLPFIDDGGTIVPDSAFIIAHLKTRYGDPLDAGLGPEQKAVAHAFTKMLDENFYWCVVHSRWIDPAAWPVVSRTFFGGMPFPLNRVVPFFAQKNARRQLHAQGIGRHRPDEILEIARRDLDALSGYLGGREFFLGERLTTLDVAAYAFLAEVLVPEMDSELARLTRGYDNLVRFVERIRERYYEAGTGTR